VVTSITADDLKDAKLDDFDVVVLANVRALAADRVAPLDRWVRAGGGLLVTAGDQIDSEEYRATMRPLLPQELADPIDTGWGAAPDEKQSRALHLTKWDADHPIFAPFSKDAPGLRDASFMKVFLLGPTNETADRHVLARFTNGAAAMVEASRDDGRVMLFTSTMDRDWNDLAIHTGFLPLVQQTVRHLARKQPRRVADEILVGRGVALPTQELIRMEVRPPEGRATVFEGERIGGRSVVRFLGTDRPGLYRVTGTDVTGATRDLDELTFAVNVDTRGSDLTPADPAKLPPSGTGRGPADTPGQRRVELWHAVAAGLLLLLLLESLLTLR